MEARSAKTLRDLGALRDTILSRITTIVAQDERVVALWLTGSIGRGEDDAWSDIDLHLAIADTHLDAWWQGRESLYHEIGPPLLVRTPKPSNAQEGAHFQLVYFPGPVEVDWNVGPESMATRPPTSQMLFAHQDIPITQGRLLDSIEREERLQRATAFFWSMAPIAIKYAGRGATTAAVDQIDLLVMGFSEVWQILHKSAYLDLQNPLVEPGLAAILPHLDPVVAPLECLEAIVTLMAAMVAFRPELEAAGVQWPGALVSQIEAIVSIARGSIEERRRGLRNASGST